MGKLGQLLVARGWITVQQLTRALKTQNVGGGRLGTCLLEMDSISEEVLLKGLAEHLGVPAVGVEDLRNIPEEVLGLLSDKLARRCRAVPFRLEVGRLDVAMLDPRNLSAQDEIAFASGKRVKVYVAHELRLLEALERYYDEELPSRYGLILDRLNRARFLWEKQSDKAEAPEPFFADPLSPFATPPRLKPPPDLPELPPPLPAAAPRPAVALAASAVAPAPRPAAAPPVAAPAPAPAPAPRPLSVALTPEERAELGALALDETGATAQREVPAPTSLDEAEAALGKANHLEEVGQILLGFLGRSYRRVALFQATKERVVGWRIQGTGVDHNAFAGFSVGFDQPSLFLNLRQGSGLYLGPLPPMPAHRQLARVWGGELPRDCVMLPVRIKDRLVMMIYADGVNKGPVDLPHIQRLAAATTSAVERCILQRKRGEAQR